MKNPERVVELLDALKAECEFRFEFDAVATVAKTVSELPRVTVIDDEHQEFLGKIYDKNKSGHYRKGNLLHRDVWQYWHGEIPKGYVIHHVDGNPANNSIENLQCLSSLEHSRLHYSKGKPIAAGTKKSFVCKVCGRKYEAFDVGNNRYCSAKCREAAHKQRRTVERTCVVCGKKFWQSRDHRAKTCSTVCASKLRQQTLATCPIKPKRAPVPQTEHRFCIICGREFVTSKYSKTQTCSQHCAIIKSWQTKHNQAVNSVSK